MEKNVKIGYVILHYQAWKETIDCVESIKKIREKTDIILIIDNHSPNHSGEILREEYLNEEGVLVIINSKNEGFAKGNNVGYIIAKQEYHCDFIVMLNNDILLKQQDFRNKLITAYEKYHFAVMGPKILQKDGTVNISSPAVPVHTNVVRARIGQISNGVRYILAVLGLDVLFGQIVDKKAESSNLVNTFQEDVQLSGCFWIFSQDYINLFDGINPGTFMYLEEILLYIRVKKAGLKMVYNPELEIIHLEDAATLETFKGKTKKARMFKYRCQMQSFKVLIDELKGKD